ncbi:hypothetical protein PMSD_01850 [Paenibacillus macquariensis subsp. defensor]|nr:hypothetical protein PMSD_01850 [Paenibacillus macquariensis subsp. defensor]
MTDLYTIETNQILDFKNLAHFRAKVKKSLIHEELNKFLSYLQLYNYTVMGPLLNVIYSNNMVDGETILDIEYLLPVDRSIGLLKSISVSLSFL